MATRGRSPSALSCSPSGGAALSLGLLAVRGPEPWQTRPTDVWGSGTFGFDIIAASVAIGLVVFFAGRFSARPGALSAGHNALA